MPLPDWYPKVRAIFAARGVSPRVWLAIMAPESSGNPRARNLGTPGHPEDSVGLFALNRRGGQGSGYSVEQLYDPVINAGIAVNSISAAQEKCRVTGKGGDIACIAAWSGHPTETGIIDPSNTLIRNIQNAYSHIDPLAHDEAQWTQAVGAGPAPAPAPTPGGGLDLGSAWSAIVGAVTGAARGGAAPSLPSGESVFWSLALGATGLAFVWTGLLGLTAPGVKAVANVAAPVLPAARGVAAAAGAVTSATGAVGRSVGQTTVKTIDAISPKVPKGTQAVRVKRQAPTRPRGLPRPPIAARVAPP